jgi:hypothetical protein
MVSCYKGLNQMPEDEDHHIGYQDQDEEIPSEMKDYGLAAFRHAAGFGPHPGEYKGPPRKQRKEGEPTESDMQRAHEEGEASSKKMQAAMRGGDLGPEQFEQEEAQQAGALQQLAGGAGQLKAAQAQAGQAGVNAPPAPTGTAGVTKPFPAQAAPGAVPTTGRPPKQQAPATPAPEESPEESEEGGD